MLEDLIGAGNQSNLIQSVVVAVILYVVYWLVRRVGRRVLSRMLSRSVDAERRVDTLGKVGLRVVLITLVALGGIIVARIWGVDLGPFVAVGAVFGAAIGFGAQGLVKDFIAGFFILAEDQFHIGDVVEIAGTTGTVEDIQFRVTVLRDAEGNKHFVPNGVITVSSNFTSLYARPFVDIGVAYKEDIDRVVAVIGDELNAMASDPEWEPRMHEPPEVLGVQELGESAVIIRSRITVLADDRWAALREALRRIKTRFDSEGIEIPFPQRTVRQIDD
jgi:small conductance mechanosensitive channel